MNRTSPPSAVQQMGWLTTTENAHAVPALAQTAHSPAWSSALSHVWAQWWLLGFCVLHLGYTCLGKGFAYLIYPPAFVGEIALLTGVPLILMCKRWRAVLGTPVVLLIMALGLWGFARTLPYLEIYRVDALRDAAVYYYAGFAVILLALFADRADLLLTLLRRFDRFGWLCVLILPVFFVIQFILRERLPTWPGLPIPIIWLKAGDPLVIAAAVVSFTIVGLGRVRSMWWYWPMILLVVMNGAISRGGLIAFCIAFLFSFAYFPKSTWPWRVTVMTLVLMTILVAVNPTFNMPGREREFSVQQFALNIYSTFADVDAGDLNDTKTWRLEWWGKIYDYTVNGEYFWGGKGFGVNLATSDGFQVWQDNSLRSPHNGNMTILARSGVPGMAIWIMLHLCWGASIALAYFRARARQYQWTGHGNATQNTGRNAGQNVGGNVGRNVGGWPRYFIWIAASYLAAMFHACFDVFIENPMGGIWLWSIMGLGMAGVYLAPRQPMLLNASPARPASPSHIAHRIDTP